MKSIQGLFDIKQHTDTSIPKKYQKRVNRTCKHIDNNLINELPSLNYPLRGTEKHKEDIENVIFYYNNPSLNSGFLDLSNKTVEGCFKNFAKELGIQVDWKYIKELLDDVDTIVLKLKFRYNRPRPKSILQNQGEIFKTIKDSKSPSFPSGHTTIAYFLASILSDSYPELKMDLEILSEMIAQSRIENGVHYQDILYRIVQATSTL